MHSKTQIVSKVIYREWYCCEHFWSRIISIKNPDHYDFKPRCPTCKAVGKSYNEATADKTSSHVKVD